MTDDFKDWRRFAKQRQLAPHKPSDPETAENNTTF
jgi:hypothetical protein